MSLNWDEGHVYPFLICRKYTDLNWFTVVREIIHINLRRFTSQAMNTTNNTLTSYNPPSSAVRQRPQLMKSLPGQGWHGRNWLWSESTTLFQNTRWLSVKRELQDWMDGPRRLVVSQPKPSAYVSPSNNWLIVMSKQRWIIEDHV